MDLLSLLSIEPDLVSFVHEVLVPGLVSDDTEVLNQFERVQLGDDTPSCLRGHVGVVVFEDVVGPFLLKAKVLQIGLGRSLVSDVLGDEEARSGEVDTRVSFSSSGLEDPVVGVEAA